MLALIRSLHRFLTVHAMHLPSIYVQLSAKAILPVAILLRELGLTVYPKHPPIDQPKPNFGILWSIFEAYTIRRANTEFAKLFHQKIGTQILLLTRR